MITWIWILGTLYILLLVILSYSSYQKNKNAEDYLMAGSNIGVAIGFLTFAATLFSTFTLMGMPDFFRTHGVGAWIFLAVSDGAMVFLIIWFGYHLRNKVAEKGFSGVSGLLRNCYGNKWAGYVFFAGIFLFLIPYVAIQVRGIAIFLNAVFPDALPAWGWSSFIVVVMLIYSEIGGLKAIIYSDVMQGLLLLFITYLVAYGCIQYFGNVASMFEQVASFNVELLSAPGPEGLFSYQFLIASFFAILFIPVTQPQLTIRMVIMRNTRAMNRMAVSVGVFAILIILPTVAIGMYGAARYPGASTADFLSQVLLYDQLDVVAAATVVGLLAAAMSTADSQIFAMGTEFRSLLSGDERRVMIYTKIAIIFFAMAALAFSIVTSDQLVLLARVSFAGTAMMAPMVLAGIFSKVLPGKIIITATGIALLVFIASLIGLVPDMVGPLRLDLLLLILTAIIALLSTYIPSKKEDTAVQERSRLEEKHRS